MNEDDKLTIPFQLDAISLTNLNRFIDARAAAAGVSSVTAGTNMTVAPTTGAVIVNATVSDAVMSSTDITTNNVTTSKHGFAPKAPNDATKFLDGTGSYTVPAGTAATDANISTSDITTNNVSTSKHGFAPKVPNDATKYLDGTGAYTVPAGGSAFTYVTGSNNYTGGASPISHTDTITHALGKRPAFVSITVSQLSAPLSPGAGSIIGYGNGWLFMDGFGNARGGITIQGSSSTGATFTTLSMNATSVSGSSHDNVSDGTSTITINNFTATTFDIVYATTLVGGSGSSSHAFPAVNWTAMG